MENADKSSATYKKMTEAPVFGLVTKLAVPTTFSMLITSVYNLADTYFVSSLGNSATSAVGVVFSIQSVIQAVGYGFGMGALSLISVKLGEKENGKADLYAVSGFVGAFLTGLLITVLGLINPPFLMKIFGSTETAMPFACKYGFWILLGAPVFCSSFVLSNVLRAQGKATLSMFGLCSGGIINIGLDALFIFVLKMGVAGAAIATFISQIISFFVLASFFIAKKSIVKINPLLTSRHISDYIVVFKTGLPTVFRQSLGSIATTLLNYAVRPYGDAAMAAVSIANKIYMLIRNMLIGVGQGFQPVAGYNYGAKRFSRVGKAFNSAAVLGTAYGVATTVILFVFSEEIMGTFRPGDAYVMETGSRMLRFLCLALPVLGYSTFVNQLYQCLGFVAPATVLASCRQGIFFIPLILILPHCIGLAGVQLTQAAADVLTFAVSVPFHIRMLRLLSKKEKQVLQEKYY